jgi:hypothetical protein
MGTRHLTAVILQEEPKVAQYGQWDGYPGGQGLTILNFLKDPNTVLKIFKDEIAKCRFVTEEEYDARWAEAGADGSGWVGLDVADRLQEKYPELSRDCGAEVLKLIYEGKTHELANSWDFAEDSLFCEWAYVIDLDKNVLEVYQGFNQEKLNENDRFFNGGITDVKYYPVKLAKSYPLDNLPSEEDFINDLREDEDEE